MCLKEYENWKNEMYTVTDTDIILEFFPYFDDTFAIKNMRELAQKLNWTCICSNKARNENCCDNPNEIVDFIVSEIICSSCGSARHFENQSFQTQMFYYNQNGSISFRNHYSAKKNFCKFLTYFQYPITIFVNKKSLTEINIFVEELKEEKNKEQKLFLFLKKRKLVEAYEYIPRLLKKSEVRLLSKSEVEIIFNEFLKFCNFYASFRKTKRRKSLPHRGFLFLKICERVHINRFQMYIRLPKLHHTIESLNKIWMEYE